MAISRDLKESKLICCGADDDDGHLYTQTGWKSLQERRKEERKGGEMEHGKRVSRVHPSPSHTELGGKKEKKNSG